jgi:hypothetical protein
MTSIMHVTEKKKTKAWPDQKKSAYRGFVSSWDAQYCGRCLGGFSLVGVLDMPLPS